MTDSRFGRFSFFLATVFSLALWVPLPSACAQDHGHHPSEPARASATPLQAPGHALFGTVQEAIRALEADSTTD